jgi:hypothetical protein
MSDPTPEQLAEAAERLGWEKPIQPSSEALYAVGRRPPCNRHDLSEEEAAECWRLAVAQEMILRYRADQASRS